MRDRWKLMLFFGGSGSRGPSMHLRRLFSIVWQPGVLTPPEAQQAGTRGGCVSRVDFPEGDMKQRRPFRGRARARRKGRATPRTAHPTATT
jgi:hypothetical protein